MEDFANTGGTHACSDALTAGELSIWLDAVIRQYGPETRVVLLAPAQVPLVDAQVQAQRAPDGQRVIALSPTRMQRWQKGDRLA